MTRMKRFAALVLAGCLVSLFITTSETHNAEASSLPVACQNNLNDAALINATIAKSKTGDEIVFQGRCLINQTIVLLGSRSYRGESRNGTVIKQADNVNLVAIFASDAWWNNSQQSGTPISLSTLTIDGNAKANTKGVTTGIIIRSWLTTITNIAIWDAPLDGIMLTSEDQNGKVVSNTAVNGTVSGNMISRSGRYGFYVKDPKNVFTDWGFTDNYVAGAKWDGIHLDNAAGWWVRGNHIYSIGHNAIWAHRSFGTSFMDNYIEGFGETMTEGTYYGIAVTMQGGATTTIANNRVNHFGGDLTKINTKNQFRFVGVTKVNSEGGNQANAMLTVTGNSLRAPAGLTPRSTGFYYDSTQPLTSLTVVSTGNLVDRIASKLVKRGNVTVGQGI